MGKAEDRINHLREVLARNDCLKYFEDADLQRILINRLTKLEIAKPYVVKPAIWALARVLPFAAGTTIGSHAKQDIIKLPYISGIVDKLIEIAGDLDRQLAAELEVEEILAGKRPAGSAELSNRLSLALRTQLKGLEHSEDIKDMLADLLAAFDQSANPQPFLEIDLPAPKEENRFVYRSSRAPFLGREREMEKLNAFLYTENDFSWWLIYGPGGLGKSRLALELCRAHGGAWRAGFLDADDETKWHEWQPDQPTLIILDYAAGKTEKAHGIARRLCKRRDQLTWPVRLLLLERDASAEWYGRFLSTHGSDKSAILEHQFQAPCPLPPLEEEAVKGVLRHYLSEKYAATANLDKLYTDLKDIDDPPRPLFAAFLADAVKANPNKPVWNQELLLKDVLEREERNFWPQNVSDKEKCLLALATMCGGITPDQIRALPDKDFFLDNDHIPAERYKAMTGRPVSGKLAPLEPDILGEMFVLNLLDRDDAKANDWTEILRRSAWRATPWNTWQFLDRLAKDFLGHAAELHLFTPAMENNAQRLAWAMMAINLINTWGVSKEPEKAQDIYEQLAQLAEKAAGHKDKPEVRLLQAQGAVNLILAWVDAGKPEKAQEVYEQLAQLAEKAAGRKDEPEVRLAQVKGTYNLILAWAKVKKAIKAQEVYEQLTQLAEKAVECRNEPEIRLLQAQSATNLISVWVDAKEPEKAQEVYDKLTELAHKNSNEPRIRSTLALATVDLTISWGDVGKPEQAQEIHNQLTKMTAEHLDEPEMILSQAKAAVNLINAWVDARKMENAIKVYDQLAVLASQHNTPEIRVRQAKGAFNVIRGWGEVEKPEMAHGIYSQLAQLAAEHIDEPEVRVWLAQSAFNLLTYLEETGSLEKAHDVYKQLAQLAKKNRDECEVRLLQAQGAVNLIAAWKDEGKLKKAQEMCGQLAKLADRYPNETKVQEALAWGMNQLVFLCLGLGHQKEALNWLGKTRALAEKYPSETEIQARYEELRPHFKSTP